MDFLRVRGILTMLSVVVLKGQIYPKSHYNRHNPYCKEIISKEDRNEKSKDRHCK